MSDEDKIKKKVTNLSKLLKQSHHPNKFYLKIFAKLDGYDMTVTILKDTGIGKLINGFKTHESEEIVEISKSLVRKWKKQVVNAKPEVKHQEPKKKAEKKPLQVYFYRPFSKRAKSPWPGLDNATSKSTNNWGIYSGKVQSAKLLSLKDLAMRVLMQNVDSIYHTGSLTCDQLKPALLKCTAEQVNLIEHRNPYLRDSLEPVWKKLVESEFRSNALIGESWKTMYWDKIIERKEKLKRLTNDISAAKQQKEQSDSQVRHLVGKAQPLNKSRGAKRSLNILPQSGSGKAPLMKRVMDSHKNAKYRR